MGGRFIHVDIKTLFCTGTMKDKRSQSGHNTMNDATMSVSFTMRCFLWRAPYHELCVIAFSAHLTTNYFQTLSDTETLWSHSYIWGTHSRVFKLANASDFWCVGSNTTLLIRLKMLLNLINIGKKGCCSLYLTEITLITLDTVWIKPFYTMFERKVKTDYVIGKHRELNIVQSFLFWQSEV